MRYAMALLLGILVVGCGADGDADEEEQSQVVNIIISPDDSNVGVNDPLFDDEGDS